MKMYSAISNRKGSFSRVFFALVVGFCLPLAAVYAEENPSHATSTGDPSSQESSSSASTPQETPVSKRSTQQSDQAPKELVQGFQKAKVSLPTLKNIESAFQDKKVLNRSTFNGVIQDLRRKDPNFTAEQAQELSRLYDTKIGVSPEIAGPQISAAARKAMEDQGIQPVGLGGAQVGAGLPGQGGPRGAAKNPLLDDDFFNKKEGAAGEAGEGDKKAAGGDPKRTELLDALKQALGKKDDKDKDKDDEKGDRGSDRGDDRQQPPPFPPGGLARDDREEDRGGPPEPPPGQGGNDRGLGALALAGLGKQNSGESSGSSDSKKEKEEEDRPAKREKKEGPEITPPTPPKAEETKLDALDANADLLNAAKGMEPSFPQNKVALPPMPSPGGGGGMMGGMPGMPGGGAGGAGGMGGMMGGMGGAPMMGGGGGGGGLPSAFQGDPFGSVGMEGMAGGAPGTFNYTRMAEFGSSGSGGESTAVGEGSGYGDSNGGKRAVSIMDEIRPLASADSSVSIVERYVGRLEEYVCGTPEGERVAVCVKAAPHALSKSSTEDFTY